MHFYFNSTDVIFIIFKIFEFQMSNTVSNRKNSIPPQNQVEVSVGLRVGTSPLMETRNELETENNKFDMTGSVMLEYFITSPINLLLFLI